MIGNFAAPAWTLVLACFALLPAATAFAEHHDGGDKPPRLVVQGDGEVRTDPDQATVRLGVTAQAETAGAAQRQVNEVAHGILEAMRALEIEERDVQTSQLSLYPVYSERQRRPQQEDAPEPEIVGYRASNVVSVRLGDLAKVGPAIDGAVRAGANEVQGVDFGLVNDLAARTRALTRAVEEARTKAEAMATALGRTLGEVIEISEGGAQVQPKMVSASLAMRAESFSTPVSPGDIEVHASVTIVYALE